MTSMAVIRTRAALAVQHDSRTAAHVTATLGLEPTESFEAGDPYARDTLTRAHSHWSLESPAGDASLEEQLRALLDLVRPVGSALAALAAEGYRLTWTCFIEEHDGDGAVSLSSALLRDLGELPVDLWLDSFADTEPSG
jgi:hypothetical protein